MDKLLGTLDERLKEVDGVVFEGRQVSVALNGEKGEPTELVMEENDTYTSRFDLYFEANIDAVTC